MLPAKWRPLVPVLLIILSLALLSLSVKNRDNTAFNKAVMEMVGPLSKGLNALAGKVEEVWLGYFHLVGLRGENEALRRALDRQTRQIVQLNEEKSANDRLRRLLGFKAGSDGRYAGARIVSWDPGPWHQSVVIDAGANDGLVEGAPVVTDRGVAGRVVELSPNYSKVLLLTDPASGIDAFVQRNRVRGFIFGRGYGQMSMEYVRKADDVRPGDLVVTSGLDGIFPPGLLIGSVTLVDKKSLGLFLEAQVVPGADLANLEEVLVRLDSQAPVDWMSFGRELRERFEERAPVGGR
ncbi:MAG: rod shape-determining protein MreC [Deltaproteobacteria bacterium]|jgi:rod shape-determining protein MreC|nr:rod shape-determining protein MreC [Deltaproteobacteria bacterium]